jgi:deferrochelatase/peroxidase EfeB
MTGYDRRRFLTAALAAGIVPSVTGTALAKAAPAPVPPAPPFHGEHQAGILEAPRRHTIVAAFDVVAESKRELTDLLRTITARARALISGGTPPELGISAPPADSGILGHGRAAGRRPRAGRAPVRAGSDRRGHPADQPHPPGQPADAGDRRQPRRPRAPSLPAPPGPASDPVFV